MHINNEDIQKYAEGELKEDLNISGHLAECAECRGKAEKYEASLSTVRAALACDQAASAEECAESAWLFLYIQNKLPAAQKESMEKHIAVCPYCRSTVIAAAETVEAAPEAAIAASSEKPAFSTFWKIFRPIAVTGVSFIFALIAYNIFIMDYSIPDMKVLHKEISAENIIENTGAVEALLSFRLDVEMANPGALDIKSVINLQNAKGILSSGEEGEQLADAAFFVEEEIKSKEQKRGSVLCSTDKVAAAINEKLSKTGKSLLSWTGSASAEEETVEDSFNAAFGFEKSGETAKAVEKYTEYLKSQELNYKEKNIRIALLRLGICYQKSQDTVSAGETYSGLVNSAEGTFEAFVAGKLIAGVKKAEKINAETEEIVNTTGAGQKLFEAAGANMLLMNYAKAGELYKKAAASDDTPLRMKDRARMNAGWCAKQAGKYEEAIKNFDDVSGLKLLALYMKADIYSEQGQGKEAQKEYDNICKITGSLSESSVVRAASSIKTGVSAEDEKILSEASQFQAGYLYLCYMGEPGKAEQIFNRLSGTNSEIEKYTNKSLAVRAKTEAARVEKKKDSQLLADFEKKENAVTTYLAGKRSAKKESQKKKWKSQEEIDKNEYETASEKPKNNTKSAPPSAAGGTITIRKPAAVPAKKQENPGTSSGGYQDHK